METKEQLVQTIKQWVKIDNEIRALQKEQVARKKEKKNISAKDVASIDCPVLSRRFAKGESIKQLYIG